MTRPYNCKHPDRGRSNYKRRLEARGLTRAPELDDLDNLRRKQTSDYWLATHPWVRETLEALHATH